MQIRPYICSSSITNEWMMNAWIHNIENVRTLIVSGNNKTKKCAFESGIFYKRMNHFVSLDIVLYLQCTHIPPINDIPIASGCPYT